MKTFEDLEFIHLNDEFITGKRARMHFDNKYGISVVSTSFSYGGREGLYEIAVLDSAGDITYNTPVTNDVIGYLSPEEVTDIMKQIQSI